MKKITLKSINWENGSRTTYKFVTLILWPWRLFVEKALFKFNLEQGGYGWVKSFGGRVHYGVDVDGDGLYGKDDPLDGKPLVAPCDGVVTIARNIGNYGNMVELRNNGLNNGYKLWHRFGHLSKIIVSEGQKVVKGQTLGFVGSTGKSTEPHVHAELWAQFWTGGRKFTVDAGKFWEAVKGEA